MRSGAGCPRCDAGRAEPLSGVWDGFQGRGGPFPHPLRGAADTAAVNSRRHYPDSSVVTAARDRLGADDAMARLPQWLPWFLRARQVAACGLGEEADASARKCQGLNIGRYRRGWSDTLREGATPGPRATSFSQQEQTMRFKRDGPGHVFRQQGRTVRPPRATPAVITTVSNGKDDHTRRRGHGDGRAVRRPRTD